MGSVLGTCEDAIGRVPISSQSFKRRGFFLADESHVRAADRSFQLRQMMKFYLACLADAAAAAGALYLCGEITVWTWEVCLSVGGRSDVREERLERGRA